MLITKEIQVCLTANMCKYYQDKGYELPRKENGKIATHTFITIKVEDLTKGSAVKVETICDNCGKHSFIAYSDYLKQLHNGKTYCLPCSYKALNSGENHYLYNSNISQEERIMRRNYPEYTNFIKSVLARDNYTCQCCGKKSNGDMQVHHLYGYSGFPKYRTDQTQSLTLCENCHKSFHSWHQQHYGFDNRGNCTREQYEEWYGKVLGGLKKYNKVLPTARKIFDYEEQKIYNSSLEYAKIHNCNVGAINACCNQKNIHRTYKSKYGKETSSDTVQFTVKGHHLFWFDKYEKMTEEEVKAYIASCVPKNFKKIICLNTLEVFQSISKILETYPNVSTNNIKKCCIGKYTYCGKSNDGTPLRWLYYEDYLLKTPQEIDEIMKTTRAKTYKSVVCLSTGVKYKSIRDAASACEVCVDTIRKYCKNKVLKPTKNFPEHWMYYSDFEKLSIEEQHYLLQTYKDSQ